MKGAIVQSSFLPWMGYFDLINSVDCFVFYDDVQYTTRDWRNRNRIKVPDKWIWLTVPVKIEKSYYDYRICEVKISYEHDWIKKHLNALEAGYRKAKFFHDIIELISSSYKNNFAYLAQLNYDLTLRICDYLEIKKPLFYYSQKMDIQSNQTKNEKLLNVLCNIGHIDEYISGPVAQAYLDESLFATQGIRVTWHEYQQPYYNQIIFKSKDFYSNLSIIDLLFNYGHDSLSIINGTKIISPPKDTKWIKP
jgi:hypothetical protein